MGMAGHGVAGLHAGGRPSMRSWPARPRPPAVAELARVPEPATSCPKFGASSSILPTRRLEPNSGRQAGLELLLALSGSGGGLLAWRVAVGSLLRPSTRWI